MRRRMNLITERYRPQSISRTAMSEDTMEILIYGVIGWDVWVPGLVDEITQAQDVRTLHLMINSPGGDAFDGIALYNALIRHPARVVVDVDGVAASAASIIMMAGDDIVMGTGSTVMIHDASSLLMSGGSTAADHRAEATRLDVLSDNIASIYAARSGGDPAAWRKAMLAETWFTAEETVSAGLATRVEAKCSPPNEPQDEDDQVGGGEHKNIDAEMDALVRSSWSWAGRDDAPPPAWILRNLVSARERGSVRTARAQQRQSAEQQLPTADAVGILRDVLTTMTSRRGA